MMDRDRGGELFFSKIFFSFVYSFWISDDDDDDDFGLNMTMVDYE